MADESVKVAVRVRPFNQRERDRNAKLIIEMQGQTTIIKNPQPGDDSKKFTFDYSYWSHDGFETEKDGFLVPSAGSVYASQQTVFDDLGQGVLKNAFAGYNCSLFAYGQTGSGKSYSLIGYGANKGIVPITCDELFKTIANNSDSNKRYEVTFAMMEIYNEQVRDLLSKENPKGGLPIRQTPDSGAFFVQGLKQVPVGSYLEISKRMEQGTASRTVASTNMNATSSRAHTIVVISFDQFIKAGSTESKKTSVMNLVDLAGSERADSTGATGDRLKEGANINKSLSALGNVIAALADLSSGSKKKIVVPYRDSVLTKLLQNALGGNSKTVMIAALSPADINYDETLSTLRYADRAKRIKTKAVINENPVEKLIRELKMENDRLKKQIEAGVVAQPIEEEYTKGLTQQGIERLRQQMLEEAMAQLTANQEKIAATEGKGPTWEDKLNMARAESFIVTNDDRKKKEAHLVNVNEDLLLSGVVFHFLSPSEPVTVGRKDAKTPPSICLNGLNIEREHAIIKVAGGDYVIQPASGSAKIKINGSVITGSTVLSHKDRILFGSSHLYVFINPLKPEADSDLPDPITWEFAQREIAQAKGYVTSESGLSVDRQIIQEQVLEILPMVSEVNAISEELNKYVTFDVVLITISSHDSKAGKGTKVMVQMTHLLTNNTWLWERGQFFNRRYLMQDMYQWWLDGDRDISQIPKEEDPFWEPIGDALIGTANIFLQSLGYVLDFDDCLTITDFKGREEGTLNVHVSPCSQNGRSLGEEHYVDEPSELLDQPYNFKVTIRNAEVLNPRYSKGLQVKYTVWGEDEQVETAMIEGTLKPQFSHSKVVSYPKISNEHLEFFDSGFITFLIYGRQVSAAPDKKLSQMSTRELRKMQFVPQKPASYERRSTMMALDTTPDLNQLKSEMTVQQRKYDRLEYKEKRLQALCNEWEMKPDDEKKFQPFFNAIKALAFSSGIKLKTRVQILNMVLRGHQHVKEQSPELSGAQKPSKLGSISEDSKAETKTRAADDDDAISVYMFGEDEDQFEREARSNGGFIKFERVANHFGAGVNNMMESRNKLQQRRQSIMTSRRSSNASMLPPPPAHLLNKAARRTSDYDNQGSPSPTPSRTEKNSSTCLVQ